MQTLIIIKISNGAALSSLASSLGEFPIIRSLPVLLVFFFRGEGGAQWAEMTVAKCSLTGCM